MNYIFKELNKPFWTKFHRIRHDDLFTVNIKLSHILL